jgi:PAS domain-containing protein
VCSKELNTFGIEDEKLLMEIGGDISFALDTIENENRRQQAIQDLKIREEKYKIVAENNFDWEYWLSEDHQFQYLSPSCERITGYRIQEFQDNPDLMNKIILASVRLSFVSSEKMERSVGFLTLAAESTMIKTFI